MITLAAILALTTALFFVLYAFRANRAANLDYLLQMEREITTELASQLDDAQRNAAYWQARTDALLCENNTLLVDLCHTDRRNSYLESLHAARKGEVAGYRLLHGPLDTRAKLILWKAAP